MTNCLIRLLLNKYRKGGKKPVLQNKTLTITENGEQTVNPDTGYDGLNKVDLTVNVSTGGVAEEKDVNFYDYDGTLVNSYTKNEFLALTEMPENPSHIGLVAQGWNWSLADAKDYVTDYGILDIGQTYTTASGKSEFDIELTTVTGLSVTLNMNGTKNWGDGTTDTEITHTYSTAGKYTITCDGTSITSTAPTGMFNQTSSTRNYYIKNVRLANITYIPGYSFAYCSSLKYIIIPNSVTGTSVFAFGYCYSLINVVIPNGFSRIQQSLFQLCYSLTNIEIPNGVKYTGMSMFDSCYSLKRLTMPSQIKSFDSEILKGCYSLTKIKVPGSVTPIANASFQNCYSLICYDFSNHSAIPTLSNTQAFSNINAIAKIVVPDSLYEQWIAKTNWSEYADYIYKASEV